MKKTALIALALIPVFAVAGCSSQTNNDTKVNDQFSTKKIKVEPQWKIDELTTGVWGKDNPTAPPIPTSAPSNEPTGPKTLDPNAPIDESNRSGNPTINNDTFLYNYVLLNDTSTKCRMTGRIAYIESYKANRGDEFNSKDYLYSLVPSTENPVSGQKVEKINGYDYAVGNYTTPQTSETNKYHKTAVRVFSTPIKIVEGNGFGSNEVGNYNSDLSKGLPVVSIDYSCPSKTDLTDKQWKDGLQYYKLVFGKKYPYAQDTSTSNPVTGQNDDNK